MCLILTFIPNIYTYIPINASANIKKNNKMQKKSRGNEDRTVKH